MKTKYKSLYLDIATFSNLAFESENAKSIVSHIVDNWFLKLNYPVSISVKKMSGQSVKYKFNRKNLEINYKQLSEGNIRHILIIEDEKEARTEMNLTPAISLSLTCNYQDELKHLIKHRVCDNIAFSLSETLLPHPISLEWQEKWVDLFKETFCRINGVNGFISMGYPTAATFPNTTAFESKVGVYYPTLSKNYDIFARALSWGTIFTQKHIELLGGIEKIKETGLFYKVEEVSLDSGKAVYLQLTEDIHTVTPEHLEKLEAFYAPILPNADDLMDWINKEV